MRVFAFGALTQTRVNYMADLYKSEAWLRRKFLVEKKTPEEIAKICDTSHMTIYRYLDKFGLKKRR